METETDLERLQRLRRESILREVVLVEVLYHDQWVRFDMTIPELQHLAPATLWRRYLAKALAEVHVPPPAAEQCEVSEDARAGVTA